jgi:arginyl-tRNA synthetase
LKYNDYEYDKSIIITADEQSGYFKVVLKALSIIQPDLAAKTFHIPHGVVDVKDESGNRVKMSSRKGNVLTGEWLIDTAKEKIQAAYSEMDDETAEKVAVASVKYALLKNSIGKNIEFSFKESISFEGNSGPYLQYTYVRTQSILKKAEKQWNKLNPYHEDLNGEEVMLLRTVFQFDGVVTKAAQELSPSTVATYLFDLAQKFNTFYQKHKIIDSEQKTFRVGLTFVVGETIKRGLDLLGIQVPEKM